MKTVLLGLAILLCGSAPFPALPARQAAVDSPSWTEPGDDMRPSGASNRALTPYHAAHMRDTEAVQGRLPLNRATVDAARRRHILHGDITGGGHRPGTGIKGESEFPAGWSDDKIIRGIESVANDPASTRAIQPNGRTRVDGSRDGVRIRVIVAANGTTIVTAYPINTPRNP